MCDWCEKYKLQSQILPSACYWHLANPSSLKFLHGTEERRSFFRNRRTRASYWEMTRGVKQRKLSSVFWENIELITDWPVRWLRRSSVLADIHGVHLSFQRIVLWRCCRMHIRLYPSWITERNGVWNSWWGIWVGSRRSNQSTIDSQTYTIDSNVGSDDMGPGRKWCTGPVTDIASPVVFQFWPITCKDEERPRVGRDQPNPVALGRNISEAGLISTENEQFRRVNFCRHWSGCPDALELLEMLDRYGSRKKQASAILYLSFSYAVDSIRSQIEQWCLVKWVVDSQRGIG